MSRCPVWNSRGSLVAVRRVGCGCSSWQHRRGYCRRCAEAALRLRGISHGTYAPPWEDLMAKRPTDDRVCE